MSDKLPEWPTPPCTNEGVTFRQRRSGQRRAPSNERAPRRPRPVVDALRAAIVVAADPLSTDAVRRLDAVLASFADSAEVRSDA